MNIALVSDFYYPFVGGVQIHIKQLATLLSHHSKIGNVIVITHKYDDHRNRYTGVKNHHGFRVYYLNIPYSKQQMITYPTFIFNFRKAVAILRQEKIDIVHCHQTGSTLALEYIFFARIIGLRVILTEHSLYGFQSLANIHFNRACQFFVSLCDKVITVSRTTKDNIILRTQIKAEKVIVIPNGVSDISHIKEKREERIRFQIQKGQTLDQKIKIISVGRMTFRRGTDLLIEILPKLCQSHDDIQLLIVGDGVKRKAVQKMIQIHSLQSKVKMLGIISDHEKLLEKMAQCDIFLNTPLTQSFGIALAEAAMLGLYCVSTNVGGVQEVIPSDYLFTASVDPTSLLKALDKVINKVKQGTQIRQTRTKFSYPWPLVCQRTVQVYQHVLQQPKKKRISYLIDTIKTGNLFQIFFAILASILLLIHLLPFFK